MEMKYDAITREALKQIVKGYGAVLEDDCVDEIEQLLIIGKEHRAKENKVIWGYKDVKRTRVA